LPGGSLSSSPKSYTVDSPEAGTLQRKINPEDDRGISILNNPEMLK